MIANRDGLKEVTRIERQGSYHEKWNFDDSDVRTAFRRVSSHGESYVLFQTTANLEAVNELKKYIGFREDMASPWSVREIKEGDQPRYVPGASGNGNGLQFDNSLMDSYQRAINKIAGRNIGEDNFAHYPMVFTKGVHNLERDPNAIFWPRIYIVNDKNCNDLKEIIGGLAGDESLEVLREQESPQFYQMAEIEILHKQKITPIVRLNRELKLGVQDLSINIDFLAQMNETYKWTGPVECVD